MNTNYTVCRGAKIGKSNLKKMHGRDRDRWTFLTHGKGWAVVDGFFMVAGIGAWKRISA